MNKFLLVLFSIVLSVITFAQTPKMEYYVGGLMNYKMSFGANTQGGGLGSGGFGRVLAPGISTGPASIFTSPAELGLIKRPVVYLDTKMTISTNTVGLDLSSELNKLFKTSTTTFLKDTTTFDFSKSKFPPIYTRVTNFDLGQSAEFSAFALALPINEKLTLGFGVYYPFNISSDFSITGFRTKLKSVKELSGQSIIVDLPLQTNFAANFNFSVNSLMFGGAYEVAKTDFGTTIVGASFNHYEVSEFVNINLRVDGMMVIQNKEAHFNNPNDPNIDWAAGETNAFYWLARGNYKTSGWGFRLGAVQKNEKWNLVFSLDIVPKFVMTDNNMFNQSYQPIFLTGSPIGKDNPLNIDINKLSLSKPNISAATKNSLEKTAETSYPSTLTIGGDYKTGSFTFGLNLVKYLSPIYLKIDKYKIGKDLSLGSKFSVDVQLADKVKKWGWLLVPSRLFPFFDIDGLLFQIFSKFTKYKNPHYRLEGGIVTGKAIAEGFTNPVQQNSMNDVLGIPFPTGISISREYTIYDRVHVGILVFSFPDFAFRYGIAYEL